MELKTKSLPLEIYNIVINKATESPHSGRLTLFSESGSYLCRQCGLALFRSQAKFSSHCGWPSFDEAIADTIHNKLDQDGHRIEIVCKRCQAHLGHLFEGESLTEKNKRYCVNSLSLDFVADNSVLDTEEVIVAAGCFWGVEYLFQHLNGVLKTQVGYCGGDKPNPTYQEVCYQNLGYYEAIRIIFDPLKITLEKIAEYFFEIHNFSQRNGQGPDIGQQYLSVAFYYNDDQKIVFQHVIEKLKAKGYEVATQLLPVTIFWPAEEYHQHYYQKSGGAPYCHRHVKLFEN